MRVRVHMCVRVYACICACAYICVCATRPRGSVCEGVRERGGMFVCLVGVCVRESRTYVYVRRDRVAVCWCGCAGEGGHVCMLGMWVCAREPYTCVCVTQPRGRCWCGCAREGGMCVCVVGVCV